jgi:hypothetical protein
MCRSLQALSIPLFPLQSRVLSGRWGSVWLPFCFGAFTFILSASRADPDNPQEIVRRAVMNYEKDQIASLRYEYTERDEKAKTVDVFRVVTIAGTPYEQLISKNAKAARHEEEKLKKAIQLRGNELKGLHDIRVRKWKEQTRFLEESPEAFDFKLLPETTVNGRPTYVMECTPKPGFQPRQDRSKMLWKIRAKAWIDKQELQIVKLEADALDPISIGWDLGLIAKGTHMELEQMRLPDNSWVLKSLSIDGRAARIPVVDNHQLDETVTYSDYKAAADLKPVK